MAILKKENGKIKLDWKGLVSNFMQGKPVKTVEVPVTNTITTAPPPTTNSINFDSLTTGGGGSTTTGSDPNQLVIKAVMNMLKAAQAGNQGITDKYLKSSGQLEAAGQLATNRGLQGASDVMTGPVYNPLNLVKMASEAEGVYNPSILAADRQLSQLAKVYGAQSDIYKNVVDTAQKIYEEEMKKEKKTTTGSSSTKDVISSMSSAMNKVKGSDGYISPEDWLAARQKWQEVFGLSDSSFISNFKRYLNPASYALANVQATESDPVAEAAALFG